ncbi:MAG: DedA family protein [bacterium]|nr:DedA family protein [bacterium]
MIEQLLNLFIKIIDTGSYAGIFFLMTLESMIIPVPSEAVMPFAGFLWFLGKMSAIPIIVSSTLGSIFGSLISYYLGFFGGRPLIKKFGRYLLLNEEHLIITENFFNRFGAKTIFFSRFIPIVRHLISIPAGIGKMNLLKFIIYTIVGAGLWNSFLAYLGYYLGNNWAEIRKYGEIIDVSLIIFIIGFIIFYFHKKRTGQIAQKTL